jgi:hypothetical protein
MTTRERWAAVKKLAEWVAEGEERAADRGISPDPSDYKLHVTLDMALREAGFVHVDPALVEAVEKAADEGPPERPLNEWRARRDARIAAAKAALADAVLAQLRGRP